jgi:predicted deacylase
MAKRTHFQIGGETIAPGTRARVDIPVSQLSNHTPVHLSAEVIHGRRKGPVLFVSAAIHGDEVIGVEIVRRLLRSAPLNSIAGTLIVVPIVNTFGFLNHSRYLPDRRDLNRVFPGLSAGSMASQLAHIFMKEVVCQADFGIDLHSAAIHRMNLPQVRLSPDNPRLAELGAAFGAPVMMESRLREGSLRMAAEAAGVGVLLYEGGEGLRFDEAAARAGLAGILRVMRHLGMIGSKGVPRIRAKPVRALSSTWYRAPRGGLFRGYVAVGGAVTPGTVLGAVANAFGDVESDVVSEVSGIVVGRTNMPVVYEGDALFHVAETRRAEAAAEEISAHLEAPALFDEDEII